MRQCDADLLLARAQVAIAIIFAMGFFGVLFFLMLYSKTMSDLETNILTGLLGTLGTLLALMMNFFYARQRPPGSVLPDPPTPNVASSVADDKKSANTP